MSGKNEAVRVPEPARRPPNLKEGEVVLELAILKGESVAVVDFLLQIAPARITP
jgi:hypothetical protein